MLPVAMEKMVGTVLPTQAMVAAKPAVEEPALLVTNRKVTEVPVEVMTKGEAEVFQVPIMGKVAFGPS